MASPAALAGGKGGVETGGDGSPKPGAVGGVPSGVATTAAAGLPEGAKRATDEAVHHAITLRMTLWTQDLGNLRTVPPEAVNNAMAVHMPHLLWYAVLTGNSAVVRGLREQIRTPWPAFVASALAPSHRCPSVQLKAPAVTPLTLASMIGNPAMLTSLLSGTKLTRNRPNLEIEATLLFAASFGTWAALERATVSLAAAPIPAAATAAASEDDVDDVPLVEAVFTVGRGEDGQFSAEGKRRLSAVLRKCLHLACGGARAALPDLVAAVDMAQSLFGSLLAKDIVNDDGMVQLRWPPPCQALLPTLMSTAMTSATTAIAPAPAPAPGPVSLAAVDAYLATAHMTSGSTGEWVAPSTHHTLDRVLAALREVEGDDSSLSDGRLWGECLTHAWQHANAAAVEWLLQERPVPLALPTSVTPAKAAFVGLGPCIGHLQVVVARWCGMPLPAFKLMFLVPPTALALIIGASMPQDVLTTAALLVKRQGATPAPLLNTVDSGKVGGAMVGMARAAASKLSAAPTFLANQAWLRALLQRMDADLGTRLGGVMHAVMDRGTYVPPPSTRVIAGGVGGGLDVDLRSTLSASGAAPGSGATAMLSSLLESLGLAENADEVAARDRLLDNAWQEAEGLVALGQCRLTHSMASACATAITLTTEPGYWSEWMWHVTEAHTVTPAAWAFTLLRNAVPEHTDTSATGAGAVLDVPKELVTLEGFREEAAEGVAETKRQGGGAAGRGRGGISATLSSKAARRAMWWAILILLIAIVLGVRRWPIANAFFAHLKWQGA